MYGVRPRDLVTYSLAYTTTDSIYSTDHVLARKGRYLERMLLAHRQAVEDKSLAASTPALLPNVHYWSEAGDVLVLFQNIFPTRNITNMQQ